MDKILNRIAALFCIALLAPADAWPGMEPALFEGFRARAIGPAAVGGRITAIDAVQADPNRMVIGVATGGVWVTENGGLTWTPVFDDEPVASIGAVAINQSNPDIIWVGTGEGNTRNSTSIGGGIFKSVDGGHSWKLMGLEASERINRIALHPTDPDTVYVAAMGTLWGPNEERGVYRSTDGGRTWERLLYVDDQTGATDIKMDPSNPDKLIAGMWQFRRWPYQFKSGGPGSGMYISLDGGASWQRRTEEDGLPKGALGRMAFSFSAANPQRIYALVEATNSALLRSDDGGRNWQKVNEEHNVADRPFYYTEVIADPVNPDRVYNMATRLRVSIDGGKSFEQNPVIDCCAPGNTVHIDNHAFWVNPDDPRHLVIGNDGGIAISRDLGATWRFVRNLPLAQFYHIRVDNEHPYQVYGGLQDNGSWRGPAEIWQPAGIRNLHWQEVGFGDGFDTIPDPENPQAGYSMSQGGYLYRYNLGTGEQRMIRPAPHYADADLRFNWDAGFAQDPFDPATIYYGSQYLHRSTDRGDSWTVISGDLTSNDPSLQTFHDSGGLTPDVTAAENYTTIVAIAPSERERGLIWVGSDDGRVHITRDGGGDWQRIDTHARGAPTGAWVHMITPSPHDAGTAFMVLDDHRRSDMAPYVYRVSDFGRRWQRLNPEGLSGYALAVLQDHVDPELLFVGTEFGLFFSVDGGDSWTRFTAGLPTVSVMDMAIQRRESDLVLGTHGRSVYVIDDYSGLRRFSEDQLLLRLAILSTTTGQHYDANPTTSTRFTGSGEFRGENEPYGVSVTFIASGDDLSHPDAQRDRQRRIERRQAGKDEGHNGESVEVEIAVFDQAGDKLRTFTHAVHQGVNRATWDLRADGVRLPPGDQPDLPGLDQTPGPEVPPGDYRLTFKLGDAETAVEVTTVPDPRSEYGQKDFEARYAAQLELRGLRERYIEALERIDGTLQDMEAIAGMIQRQSGGEDPSLEPLGKRAKEISQSLKQLDAAFRNPPDSRGIVYHADKPSGRLQTAQYYLDSIPGQPSEAARAYVDLFRQSLHDQITALNIYLAGDLADFRAAVSTAGVGLLNSAEPVPLPD